MGHGEPLTQRVHEVSEEQQGDCWVWSRDSMGRSDTRAGEVAVQRDRGQVLIWFV